MEVKCTLVQALRLCTGCTAHRGIRGIALPFHDHGTRRGCMVSVTPRPLFTSRKDLVPIVQEAGWAPGPVWTGAENFAPTGIWPRTVQPVASRYTDYATWPTFASRVCSYFYLFGPLRGWLAIWNVPAVSKLLLPGYTLFTPISIVPWTQSETGA